MSSHRDANFGQALLLHLKGEVIEARTGARLGGAELQAAVSLWANAFARTAGRSSASAGPIFLALELTLESVLAYLGALASGHTVLTLDAREWARKAPALIDYVQPALCWLPARLKKTGLSNDSAVMVVQGESFTLEEKKSIEVINHCNHNAKNPLDHPSTRLLVPTSGSTGKPAIVKTTDRNLAVNTGDIIASQGLDAQDCALLCLPLNYCFGASVLHTHLWVGGSVVIDDRLMFAEKVLDAIDQYGCTSFAGVPTSYTLLQHHSRALVRSFPTIRRWLQAGGYLAASVVHAFREAHPYAAFMIMYGQTEATSRITTFIVEGDYPQGCVGYPLASLRLEIREAGTDLPRSSGLEGIVWVQGDSVSAGYLYGGSHTKRFTEGWLNTGDVGYLLEDGRLCITGRAAGFIKIRGRRVGSQEVENLLWEQFSIHSCACPLPDQALGEIIGLYLDVDVSDAKGANGIEEQWSRRIRDIFPTHWDLGPVLCGRLPLTSNGKIDRWQCQQRLKGQWTAQ